MILLPAIDLFGRKAVRLYQGDYKQMTVYNENPASVAEDFRAAGANWIHMVDLEGAKTGDTPNYPVAAEVAASGMQVEIGGGIRSEDTVKKYLDAGVARVILGTAAITNWDFLCRMVERYGEKIAVGVDLRDGFVAIRGWTELSDTRCEDFFEKLQSVGVRTVICTDISRDGAMRGTNRALYEQLSRDFSIDIVASGGVSSLEDVIALRRLDLYGAIIGKAYYTGAIDLREALEAAK
ncbi:MAG: 1-(5-phosphoribosyl)-5-[(5-phosphoribosylamino)methylideneamino]imidazole-4-carboxamide isomerase [Ruminococcaceae bacterium]|nr:1-(5-phosphoribosyl)-5-[(5-phosphoribosylamino)methylideneamino]imidazole-4-carboxamide isomerase [Oscillospiraceae bacterium]